MLETNQKFRTIIVERRTKAGKWVFHSKVIQEKVVFVSGAGKEAVKAGVHAGQLVKKAAQICSGNGGGKPDMAQAGGKDASKVDEAINAITEELKSL